LQFNFQEQARRLEADWEFEVGGDAPVIDALWLGFVDLRWTAQSGYDQASRVRNLSETVQFPALGAALEKLNAENSPVWTSKCDFWPALQPEDFDGDELDAPIASTVHAVGCYIDLLLKGDQSDQQSTFPEKIASRCKKLCTSLHSVSLRCCRVDLIVRRAQMAPDLMDMGITAYFTACGATPAEAVRTLEASLAAFTGALCARSTVQ
jgi:hypothetical protein